MAELEMYRGDTKVAEFTFSDDTTFQAGDTVWFTVKRRVRDDDADALVYRTSANGGITFTPGQGVATATIEPADTEDLAYETTLVYDWQLLTAAGAVKTLDKGTILVKLDVTITRE